MAAIPTYNAKEYAELIGVNPTTTRLWRRKEGYPKGSYRREIWEQLRHLHGLESYEGHQLKSSVVPVVLSPIEASEQREENSTAQRLKKVEAELADRHRLETAVVEAVSALPVLDIRYVPLPREGLMQATPVLMIGDQHAGNACAPLEVIADRFSLLRQKYGHWIDTQRAGYTCEECFVFGMGDYVEGALRASARQSNTVQEPEQALGVGNLIGSFVKSLSSQFERVHLKLVMVDNHARLDEKMNFEQAVSRSWNPIVESVIQSRLEHHTHVTVEAPWDFACHVKVENTRFLLIHGNGIRMMRRTPFYGIEDRLVLEKATRQGTPTEFDIMCLAHFHHIGEGQSWFMNPPMVGTTGYDKASGRETTSAQTAFLVSPNHIRPFQKTTFELGEA